MSQLAPSVASILTDVYTFYHNRPVIVTGGAGFLGTTLVNHLHAAGAEVLATPRRHHNLLHYQDADDMMRFAIDQPDTILFHLAAHVNGIEYTRTHPADHLVINTTIANNVITAAVAHGISYVVAAGSVCAYPETVSLPMSEHELWRGRPEASNRAYGEAKRYLLSLLDAYWQEDLLGGYAYLIAANLYGPGDRFDPVRSHVIPALILKANALADTNAALPVWGDGNTTRDFLYVEDAALAYLLAGRSIVEHPRPVICNIGSGTETTIGRVARIIADHYGIARLAYETDRPRGQARRLLAIGAAERLLGWRPSTPFATGLRQTLTWYDKRDMYE